jgi:hypothetical protein
MPDASDAVKKMAKMGREELKKFASTKHKGLPEKVKEENECGCEDSEKKKETEMDPRQMKTMKDRVRTSLGLMGIKASYEPEGEVIDERTRFAKKKNVSATTGRPSVEGGNPEIAAQNKRIAPATIGGSRQAPKDRRGRVKPVLAGEPGSGRQDPAHVVKVLKAKRKRLSDISTQQMQDTRGT